MRFVLLPGLALLALLCVMRPAHAQVHRCMGANGEPAFTDQPCGTQEPSVGVADSANGVAPADTGVTNNADGAQSAGTNAACPRSPQALRERIALAFNGDDPNALAGLIDWRGYDRHGANARMREFEHWLKEPLIGVEFIGPPDPSGALPGDADYTAPDPWGVTVLTQPHGEDFTQSRNFGVMQRGGCWWLSF
ncbi:MAG TPA: hypothetical protein VGK80_06055 [Rhodanobacteraceae bacterium]